MRTAAKVFIWISMICLFFLVYPIVVGVLALKKLNKTTSKEDLKTIGILTLLFCNTLAGIFMLCLEDSDYPNSTKTETVTYKKTIVDNNYNPQTKHKVESTNKILVYISAILVSLSFVFSLIPICLYRNWGVGTACFVFSCIILLIFIILLITFFVNHQKHNLATIILSSILFALSIVVLITSIFSISDTFIIVEETYYNFYWKEYRTSYTREYIYAWQYWIVFGSSCLMTIISAFTTIFYILMNKKISPKKVIKEKIVINNVETELLELKRLLDNKTITQNEYEQIRLSVISKYYKL